MGGGVIVPTLADLDDDFVGAGEPLAITPAMYAALPAAFLSNGFFTLTFPSGEHRTYRVRLDREGIHAGKRTLALLIGPDNTSDYECQATVAEDGFKLFKRFARGKTQEHAQLLWMLAKGDAIEGYELLVSKRCRVCNRPLTDEISIKTEVGPTCRKRVGL
jgi:hypothetical protein